MPSKLVQCKIMFHACYHLHNTESDVNEAGRIRSNAISISFVVIYLIKAYRCKEDAHFFTFICRRRPDLLKHLRISSNSTHKSKKISLSDLDNIRTFDSDKTTPTFYSRTNQYNNRIDKNNRLENAKLDNQEEEIEGFDKQKELYAPKFEPRRTQLRSFSK